MVEFTGITKILARDSVRLGCFESLLISVKKEKLGALFHGIDRIDEHVFYLNDDDEVRPPIKVKRRLKVRYLDLVLYEGQLGDRQPDTDDFDSATVAKVVGDLYMRGYWAVIDKMDLKQEDAAQRKAAIEKIMSEFIENFDPTKSPRFGPQPKRNRQKFWLTPPPGIDPFAFRHD